MPRRFIQWVAVCAAAGLLATGAGVAAADPTDPPPAPDVPGPAAEAEEPAPFSDDLPNPLEADRRELRDRALRDVIDGQRAVVTKTGSKVVRLDSLPPTLTRAERDGLRRGRAVGPRRPVEQYVEVSPRRTDRVFVLLVEFGDERLEEYPDVDTNKDIPGPQIFPGPAHDTIPAPDRGQDNTTIWQPEFNREHYTDLYFGSGSNSLKSYYEKQSSGRYSIEGEVSDWVKVRYNQARYGRSNGFPCQVNVCANSWYLLRDGLNAWVAQQRAAGRTPAEIKSTLASYDVWDRYDLDRDGNFNEPDGYLDRLQIVHSGGDQANDDPYFGEDAVWSHRWRAFQKGEEGPGPPGFQIGGSQIADTGIWAADYTMQAENAGLAVIAHEYGHDLGLPDHYDTADPGDNPVNWWTLMGQSRLKDRNDVGVGTKAADLGAWDKLQLGWLDHKKIAAGEARTVDLGPHEYNSAKPQALLVTLPRKQTPLPQPASGTRQWWSGTGDNYASALARFVTLPAASQVELSFQANFNIEADCETAVCDQAFVEVGTGTGPNLKFTPITGSITSGPGNGIAGRSNGWQRATFDLSRYAGQTVALRFRYVTNAAVEGADPGAAAGLFVDDILVTADGARVLSDGAENGANGWTLLGFFNVGSVFTSPFAHYYLASYRADLSYDSYLETGPYNFGWAETEPRRAEFFGYQYGLLVSYWNTAYTDNNTSVHPGRGFVLPVDARPGLLRTKDGDPWRGRVQTYDAPFSLRASDSMVLRVNGSPNLIKGQRGQPVFDDTTDFWNAEQPAVGVKTPKLGVTLRVSQQTGSTMTVEAGVSPGSPLAR